MDRISPVDLEHVKLRKGLRGYLPDDVNDLIRRTSGAIENLLRENAELKDLCTSQQAELAMLKRDTRFVQEALITAQKTADEIRIAAQKHAELIVEEARQVATAEKNAAQQKVTEWRWELDRLKQDRQRFVEDFRILLERHLREVAAAPPTDVTEEPA